MICKSCSVCRGLLGDKMPQATNQHVGAAGVPDKAKVGTVANTASSQNRLVLARSARQHAQVS